MDAVCFLRASRFCITYGTNAQQRSGHKASRDLSDQLRHRLGDGTQITTQTKATFSASQSLSGWTTARMATKRKTHPYSTATSAGSDRSLHNKLQRIHSYRRCLCEVWSLEGDTGVDFKPRFKR